jgi:hypothetical protein
MSGRAHQIGRRPIDAADWAAAGLGLNTPDPIPSQSWLAAQVRGNLGSRHRLPRDACVSERPRPRDRTERPVPPRERQRPAQCNRQHGRIAVQRAALRAYVYTLGWSAKVPRVGTGEADGLPCSRARSCSDERRRTPSPGGQGTASGRKGRRSAGARCNVARCVATCSTSRTRSAAAEARVRYRVASCCAAICCTVFQCGVLRCNVLHCGT